MQVTGSIWALQSEQQADLLRWAHAGSSPHQLWKLQLLGCAHVVERGMQRCSRLNGYERLHKHTHINGSFCPQLETEVPF